MLPNATTQRQERIPTVIQPEGGKLRALKKVIRITPDTFRNMCKRARRPAMLMFTFVLPLGVSACANGIVYTELRDRNGNITGVALSPTAPVWVTGRPGHQVINAAPYDSPYQYQYGYPISYGFSPQQLGPTRAYGLYRGMVQSGQISPTCGYYAFLNNGCY